MILDISEKINVKYETTKIENRGKCLETNNFKMRNRLCYSFKEDSDGI